MSHKVNAIISKVLWLTVIYNLAFQYSTDLPVAIEIAQFVDAVPLASLSNSVYGNLRLCTQN